MRFANIYLLTLIGLALIWPQSALATPWQLLGREILTLELPESRANERISKFNQKLVNILPRLNGDRPWLVDVRLTYYRRSARVKQALIRLEGYNLIFITEADAKTQGFSTVSQMANAWSQSLAKNFADPAFRQLLLVGMGMPAQVNYRGVNYYISPNIARDRGLFRTNGKRFMGRVIFWEVPADNNTYQITANNQLLEPSTPPDQIFLINGKRQFLTYTQTRS